MAFANEKNVLTESNPALDLFKSHWKQAWDIMQQTDPIELNSISSIVHHIEQMEILLAHESSVQTPQCSLSSPISNPLLEYLFNETILEKLSTWTSLASGEFHHVMIWGQLKFYELLISEFYRVEEHFHKLVVRPLLSLLSQCMNRPCEYEVEKRLVVLLNTLIQCFSENIDLMQFLFQTDILVSTHGGTITSILLSLSHREGAVGQQATDTLIFCLDFSRNNDIIGLYFAEESNLCPTLVSNLCSLYSLMPVTLTSCKIITDDWHQLSAEDVKEVPGLRLFLNSLEFCNAVIEVSPPMVQSQLLDFVYSAFLVPVIGPALQQVSIRSYNSLHSVLIH